jgi:hypothetical protein
MGVCETRRDKHINHVFVRSPIEETFISVLKEATDTLFVAAPYIKEYGVQKIAEHTAAKKIRLLTNLDLRNVTGAGFDIGSLLCLWNSFDLSVASLGKLHAKVYIADRRVALVTSANLTLGGLWENYEYGVVLRDATLVSRIVDDVMIYFNLGSIFTRDLVEQIRRDTNEIIELQKRIAKSKATLQVNRLLRQKTNTLQTRLLENRVKGKTINAIFSDTILYLLGSVGPLTTEELHPLIQNTHPDICDDTIDRVINGQRFGKKWKHMVRNAQQYLKTRKLIEPRGHKWTKVVANIQLSG